MQCTKQNKKQRGQERHCLLLQSFKSDTYMGSNRENLQKLKLFHIWVKFLRD